ncbi:MAG: chorismate synthase [Thermoleophilia bacterium]
MPFRYTTAGESHGPELIAITEGVPAGLTLGTSDINSDLSRRQLGYGRGGRMKIETDTASIVSGVRQGTTLGSPIAVRIENADWKNWRQSMSADAPAAGGKETPLTVPRPGHADLAGLQKYGLGDVRSVLERASARETAARVAVGAIARKLLSGFGVTVLSHVIRIGRVGADLGAGLTPDDFLKVDESPVRCLDGKAAESMKAAIDDARKAGESLGGVFEVVVFGLVPGLGSYASGPERLGGRIGGALMSIPAIKGAEIGGGFSLAALPGSKVHDEIFFQQQNGYSRGSNNAGGLEGGVTNGEALIARAAMKPIPTLTSPLKSVDVSTGKEQPALKERSDVCAVPAAAVVGEAMVAVVLADAMLAKFGSDSVADIKESYLAYLGRLRGNWPKP